MVVSPLIGSHILFALSTYIIGYTPFPEYSVVVALNDIQLMYYDSNVKIIYRNYKSEHEEQEQKNADHVFKWDYDALKDMALFARSRRNITQGVLVVQRLSSCELLDETVGAVGAGDALEGVTEEELTFNAQNNTLSVESEGLWRDLWDQQRRDHLQMLITKHYLPICITTLKNVLRTKRKEMVAVRPSVEFLQNTLPDSSGAKVTCLATGFYPRHSNLTLLRDGQSMSDHQVTGGELLPNGDETYQMRKSLEVSAEELREKHQYSCMSEHTLDKLTIHLVPGCTPFMELVLICGTALMVFISVAGAITAFTVHRRRRTNGLSGPRPSPDQTGVPLRREARGAGGN
ncbi:major histocompatibility complex class I-related gene protein-like [Sardina pilchardus]|uniref:major histocompatibility complex class I-related gene protein-like n=1 Tax=Sardina pilchardus TaxID=27697 RepID=UPI002E0DC9BD